MDRDKARRAPGMRMLLTRERIRDGWVQKMIMQGGDDVRALTEQELLEFALGDPRASSAG